MLERELRDMAFVPRWAIIRRIKDQSVAEHSFFVALYAWQICHFFGFDEKITNTCVKAALMHDFAETLTGDVPGPVKRMTNMQQDNAEEKAQERLDAPLNEFLMCNFDNPVPEVLSLANRLDELMYLAQERQMGNRSIPPSVTENCAQGFKNALNKLRETHAYMSSERATWATCDEFIKQCAEAIAANEFGYSKTVGG